MYIFIKGLTGSTHSKLDFSVQVTQGMEGKFPSDFYFYQGIEKNTTKFSSQFIQARGFYHCKTLGCMYDEECIQGEFTSKFFLSERKTSPVKHTLQLQCNVWNLLFNITYLSSTKKLFLYDKVTFPLFL